MRTILRNLKNLLLAVLLKRKRFVRLTPNTKGKILFFDKKKKYFLNFNIRESIDSYTADQIYTYEEYDLKFLKRYSELNTFYKNLVLSNKKPLIIDAGANIGCSSYYFATEFDKSYVIAIEPESNNYLMLKKNCSKLKNICFMNKAIGSENSYVEIENLNVDNNAFITKKINKNSNSIEMISVDNILSNNTDCYPFIIKLDIEGSEEELFSNNVSWVDKFPIIIIEFHDWMLPRSANSKNFLNVISQKNRDFIYRGEYVFSIANDLIKI